MHSCSYSRQHKLNVHRQTRTSHTHTQAHLLWTRNCSPVQPSRQHLLVPFRIQFTLFGRFSFIFLFAQLQTNLVTDFLVVRHSYARAKWREKKCVKELRTERESARRETKEEKRMKMDQHFAHPFPHILHRHWKPFTRCERNLFNQTKWKMFALYGSAVNIIPEQNQEI